MIYSLLSKNVGSHIYALLLAKVTRMPGLGGGGGGVFVCVCVCGGGGGGTHARLSGTFGPPSRHVL